MQRLTAATRHAILNSKPCFWGSHPCSHVSNFISVLFAIQGEEAAFVEGVRRHGREAKLIARDLGTGRSIGDVKKYYQKHKKCARPLRIHSCCSASAHQLSP